MQKEQITDKQAICIFIPFMIGSTLIIGIGGEAKNDAWVAGIVGAIMAVPMLLVYARMLSLFPGKDLFDILNITLGKVFGKIVAIIYILYAFHLGALVLRNFGEFINTVAMPETPMFVPMFCMGIVCVIAVRLGIEVLGRTTTYFLPLIFFILVIVQLLVIPQIHLNYLKPILENDTISILKGGFSTFSFPYAETVLFIGVFGSLKSKKSPIKVYLWGTLISTIIIIVTTIRNIAVLGSMIDRFYFPSYQAVSRINIGDFLERIEVTVAIVFIFSVLIKGSICLLVACKGIQKVFNLKDYRSIVIQTGLLMVYFAYTIYDNSMEMKYWAFKVYSYYAFPMQVILPIIIWAVAEIKRKINSSAEKGEAIPESTSR
ncbi:GerAB/ArcD/ProY family transporter [Caproiciproducens faecalis]|uniref:Endospore germination permease n=1 Tax=Caproiciproducens faecalis TaxID=2820301 RepID=A0ABS7DKT7_9FIRM|nr:endospore germination permease [Caproiciproducens faecalis]MBW7571916.1 endospore germination permease [Caproiciproducens faecalis]